jgi:ankyrin repeat protein
MLDVKAKQLVENKYVENENILKSLTDFDKFCLNKFYNMNFENIYVYSDEFVWLESCRKGYVKVVQHFINKSINVNIKNNLGYTGFMIACFNVNVKIVELLLQQKHIKTYIVIGEGDVIISYKRNKEIQQLLKSHKKSNSIIERIKRSSILSTTKKRFLNRFFIS